MFRRFLQRVINSIRRFFRIFQTSSSQNSQHNDSSFARTIRIVGDRQSGKTTYMAALIRHPNPNPEKNPVKRVVPVGSDGERLENQAMNILEQGLEFQPTRLLSAAVDPTYGLTITIKGKQANTIELNILSKDYSGELFRDICIPTSPAQIKDYMLDCAKADGILFLLDGTTYRKDSEYEASLKAFLRILDREAADGWQGRIAFALSKCENTELYFRRKELGGSEGLVKKLFPKTMQCLQAYLPDEAEVEYFTLSSFGMMGSGSRKVPNINYVDDPNDPTIKNATLHNKNAWQPFGLVAPLYWLCTGDRYPELE